MRIVFIAIFLVFGLLKANAQDINFEQIAFEHFFKNGFVDDYANVDIIQFDGLTENELSNFALFKNCLNLKDETIAELDKKAYGETFTPKKINLSTVENVSFKGKKVKSKLRMYIYQANHANKKYYVILGIIKPKYFTRTYYYEFDSSGNILNSCETGMTE